MLIPLLVVGIALVVLGVLVLLLFPDRPGGRLEFRGVSLQSTGAGLPLVVLGVVAIGAAAFLDPSETDDDANVRAGDAVDEGQSATGSPSVDPNRATESTLDRDASCFDEFLDDSPTVGDAFRFDLSEGDAVPLEGTGVVPTAIFIRRDAERIGAVKLGQGGNVIDVVDSSCQPVPWQSTDLDRGEAVTLEMEGVDYEILIDREESTIPTASLRRLD